MSATDDYKEEGDGWDQVKGLFEVSPQISY
jgi:hypothetical protein